MNSASNELLFLLGARLDIKVQRFKLVNFYGAFGDSGLHQELLNLSTVVSLQKNHPIL